MPSPLSVDDALQWLIARFTCCSMDLCMSFSIVSIHSCSGVEWSGAWKTSNVTKNIKHRVCPLPNRPLLDGIADYISSILFPLRTFASFLSIESHAIARESKPTSTHSPARNNRHIHMSIDDMNADNWYSLTVGATTHNRTVLAMDCSKAFLFVRLSCSKVAVILSVYYRDDYR